MKRNDFGKNSLKKCGLEIGAVLNKRLLFHAIIGYP